MKLKLEEIMKDNWDPDDDFLAALLDLSRKSLEFRKINTKEP